MTTTNAAERIRQLQAEANAELEQIDQRMTECRRRIYQLAQNGTLSADEARQQFDDALTPLVAEGEKLISRQMEQFTRPRLPCDLDGVISGLSFRGAPTLHNLLSTWRDDNAGPVLACLFADQLRERFRAVTDEACSGDTLPPPDERSAEIAALASELKELEVERDDLQDELSKAFSFQESDRTKQARRHDQEQAHIDRLNERPDQPKPDHAELLRTVKV